MAPDVSIIVVNQDARERTLACLESIRAATAKIFYELIVVDNKSSDGSPTVIRERVPEATVMTLQEQIGFAEACNQGARQAKGRFILLLDPGAVVQDGAIDRLVAFARCTADARIWGGRTLDADRSPNTLSCAARPKPWHLFCQIVGLSRLFKSSPVFNGEAYGGWRRDSVRVVDIVASRFMLVETGLWRQLNGFDPALFMDDEDADLCLRAAKLGATPLITPDSEIVVDAPSLQSPTGERLIHRMAARSTMIRKHWPAATRWIGHALLQAQPLTHWLAARTGNGKVAANAWTTVIRARNAWAGGYRARPIARAWASTVTAQHRQPVSVMPAVRSATISTV